MTNRTVFWIWVKIWLRYLAIISGVVLGIGCVLKTLVGSKTAWAEQDLQVLALAGLLLVFGAGVITIEETVERRNDNKARRKK